MSKHTKQLRFLGCIFSFFCITSSIQAQTKPNIWIHTDMTSVTGGYKPSENADSEAVTDQNSDADDHVAMAMYLMLANKFNTRGIIVGVTNRNTTSNTKTFFDNTFIKAYETDVANLTANGVTGYPSASTLKGVVKESSLTSGSGYISFNTTANAYDNLSSLPATAQDLVNELKSTTYSATNPLYVCVWGPLTEVAMATKHLIRTGNTAALNRLYVVSHWTTSYINQGTETQPFDVANCNSGKAACDYMHNEAKKTGAQFKFVDLGSIGQGGIVNGSQSWFTGGFTGTRATTLKKSQLGNLAMISKFAFKKPDGSDCATFYAILGSYGVKLSNFSSNGTLTKTIEQTATNNFSANAGAIWDELLGVSNKALSGSGTTTCSTVRKEAESFSAQSGTQVENNSYLAYINNGDYADYSVNVPCAGSYTFRVRVASASPGGTLTFRKGTTNLGSVTVGNTGGWTTWQLKTVNVTLSAGIQTFRLAFSGTGSFLYNVDWFELQKNSTAAIATTDLSNQYTASTKTFKAFPNPSSSEFTLELDADKNMEEAAVFNQSGQLLYRFTKSQLSDNRLTFGKELKTGVYILRVAGKENTQVIKLIKQ